MKILKLMCLVLILFATGCSSRATYVVGESGYRDNNKLIKLLNAEPNEVARLYPDLKMIKMVKPVKVAVAEKKISAPVAVTQVAPSGVVTIYNSAGKQVLFSPTDWAAMKPLFPDLKKEAEMSRNGRVDYKLALFQIEPFSFDQADIDPKYLQDQIANVVAISNAKGYKPFLVLGYADPIGPDVHNQVLSVKRAETVRDELEKYNFGGVRVVPLGATDQFAVDAGTDKQKNGPNRTVWVACFDQ